MQLCRVEASNGQAPRVGARVSRDSLRMIYGLCLLTILAGLALAIAVGHVEEKSSYGLVPVLMAISSLSGQFAQWAFRDKDASKDDEPAQPAAQRDGDKREG